MTMHAQPCQCQECTEPWWLALWSMGSEKAKIEELRKRDTLTEAERGMLFGHIDRLERLLGEINGYLEHANRAGELRRWLDAVPKTQP